MRPCGAHWHPGSPVSDGGEGAAGRIPPGRVRVRDGCPAGIGSGLSGVAVVGSANVDLIATVAAAPEPGQTVLAADYAQDVGGKGLNQAVAAARRAATALVASVGEDAEGARVRAHAERRGVDVSATLASALPTGRALITLLPGGDNTIVVAALANGRLSADAVTEALERLRPAVVLVQFEIPEEAVEAAARWTREAGARLLVNPSPMRPIAAGLLATADPLIVNLGEAAELVGAAQPGADGDTGGAADDGAAGDALGGDAAGYARLLAERAASVVVTAGPDGAAVCAGESLVRLAVPERVEVRDSSGAGDEFAGCLAAALASGADLASAAEAAVAAATRIVATRRADR